MGAVGLWGLQTMKNISLQNSGELGSCAAQGAETALEKMAGEQVQNTVREKAVLLEERFEEIEACLQGIVRLTEDIYEEPQKYPERSVALPEQGSRELAAQLLWSERLSAPSEAAMEELLRLGNIQDLLVQYNAGNEMISSAYVATVSGWMIQADYIAYSKYTKDTEQPDCYEAENRQWYQLALNAEEGKISYTEVMKDIHQNEDCIVCSLPIRRNGKVVAVAGIGSYLADIHEVVLNTDFGKSGYAFLVNENGEVMVSGNGEGEESELHKTGDLRESRNLSLAAAAKEMTEGNSGMKKMNLDNREVYLAYAPLTAPGWSFAAVLEVEKVVAPAKQMQQEILQMTEESGGKQNKAMRQMLWLCLCVTAVVMTIVSFASAMLGNKISGPVRKLTKAVAEMDGGNMDKRVQLHTRDELEELGKTFNAMAEQISSYIKNLKKVTAEKERIRTELCVAAGIQSDMLPKAEEHSMERKEISMAARMVPAKEVGGDFYDFFYTDEDHFIFVVADVAGKGVPAALFMVIAMTMLRSRIPQAKTLEQAVEEVNESLCRGNPNSMFVTAWIGRLTLSEGKLEYVNAGHNPPLICSRQGVRYLTGTGDMVLGGRSEQSYRQSELKLEPGDLLLLYTDGVTEAMDTEHNQYGEERLGRMLEKNRNLEPEKLISAVWQDVSVFEGGEPQFDDITMLALRYVGFLTRKTGAKLSQLRQIMEFTDKVFTERGIPLSARREIKMAEDEVFSNICYYSGASEVTVGCRVEKRKNELWAVIFFEDDGTPYNPLKKEPPDITLSPVKRPTGGLGIYLVGQLMDEVKYEYRGRNRLIFCKAVPLGKKKEE